ncbi:MAG TPA: hypothetical protein PKY50_00280 [Candidatus Competibacter sp.]|nr:hypothetical protein [Candidatus Competibacter sp.]
MSDTSLRSKLLKQTELRYKYLPELSRRLAADDKVLGAILQGHLFVESLLEQLIQLCLGQNAEAVLSARLTFDQKLVISSKLCLADNWPLIPDYVVGSLRKLNSLRNKLAHRYGHEVTESDLRELFVGLESELPYQEVLEHGAEIAISRYIAFIFGHLLPKYEPDAEP